MANQFLDRINLLQNSEDIKKLANDVWTMAVTETSFQPYQSNISIYSNLKYNIYITIATPAVTEIMRKARDRVKEILASHMLSLYEGKIFIKDLDSKYDLEKYILSQATPMPRLARDMYDIKSCLFSHLAPYFKEHRRDFYLALRASTPNAGYITQDDHKLPNILPITELLVSPACKYYLTFNY